MSIDLSGFHRLESSVYNHLILLGLGSLRCSVRLRNDFTVLEDWINFAEVSTAIDLRFADLNLDEWQVSQLNSNPNRYDHSL